MKTEIEKLHGVINCQNDQINTLNEKMNIQERDINNIEQNGRANSLRITGIVDDRNETVEESVKKVAELCEHDLDVHIEPNDIDIAHRIGRYNEGYSRTIICKFVQRRVKDKVIKNRSKQHGSGKVIREDMTTGNNTTLYVAKNRRR